MAAQRITKRLVDAAKPEAERLRVWDSELAGFCLQIMPSGHKSYFYKYRVGGGRAGRVRWAKIGDHGVLTPDQARDIARRWAAEVATGGDPAETRSAQRAAPTISELLDRYLSEHAAHKNKARTAADAERLVDKVIRPALGKLKVADVTAADVARFHGGRSATPYQANRALAVLSKAFNLAELWGLRAKGMNPCEDVQRYPETARERSLSAAEFASLGAALVQAEQGPLQLPPGPAGDLGRSRVVNPQAIRAIRLLIFTGARVSEILGLRWEYLDLEAGRAHLPDSKTGTKVVQLPAPALEVLAVAERPASGRGYVIRGRDGRNPEVPLVNIKDPWSTICEVAGLQELRLHDLRHAFASAAVNDGLSLPIIGALLGHRETRTTQRYAHLADNPQKIAAAQVAGRIAHAMRALP